MNAEHSSALVRVRKSSLAIPMGHEELILPMLVWRSSRNYGEQVLGQFYHCVNGDHFTPNDMSGTAIVGYASGCTRYVDAPVVNVRTMFVGIDHSDWERVPEIRNAFAELGKAYEYFTERSTNPLGDGYIARCRFIAHGIMAQHYLHDSAIQQDADAGAVVKAFLTAPGNLSRPKTPLGYCPTVDYGDDENYSTGYGIWIERKGVVRVWTRIVYVPK